MKLVIEGTLGSSFFPENACSRGGCLLCQENIGSPMASEEWDLQPTASKGELGT